MARQTSLSSQLRKWGLNVVEHSGWTGRGSTTFNPRGVVDHHTAAGGSSDAPSLRICIYGRADLSGPLAQIVLGRTGTVHLIAAGRANHAGRGGWQGLSGNSSVFGIEAENNGVGEPWSDAQIKAYIRVNAALCDMMGRGADWVCGHKEWAPGRKIDPNGIDMNWMRQQVQALLNAGPGAAGTLPPPPVKPANPQPTKWTPESGNTLSFGEHGPRVKEWQSRLNRYAGADLKADGYFGASTRDATTDFQRFFKLTPDGIAGPNTLGMMDYIVVNRAKPRPLLKKGDKGDVVRELQSHLNRIANQGLWEDGDFGPATEKAVKNFQKFFKLTADGVVGPKTWEMIDYLVATR